MNVGQFNVGSDTTVTIIVDGVPLGASILTSFDAKQVSTQVKSKAINGVVRARELPEGWDIDLEYNRGDSLWDDLFATMEAARYAGQKPPHITLLEKTVNPIDQSVSRYRYEHVTLKLDTIGSRKGDANVEPKISGFASRRIPA